MTTLAILKAAIATDLARDDLTGPIATAISTAITFYQPKRFYFNESRSATFATVAAQSRYSSADDTDIPKFVQIDGLFVEDGSDTWEQRRIDPLEMEFLIGSSDSSGRPYCYSYFDQTFAFHPTPDDAYTVRALGLIKKDAPASDAEASNVWMTDGYELIRCRAKWLLAMHNLIDPSLADRMAQMERIELTRLREETGRKVGYGRITPTEF